MQIFVKEPGNSLVSLQQVGFCLLKTLFRIWCVHKCSGGGSSIFIVDLYLLSFFSNLIMWCRTTTEARLNIHINNRANEWLFYFILFFCHPVGNKFMAKQIFVVWRDIRSNWTALIIFYDGANCYFIPCVDSGVVEEFSNVLKLWEMFQESIATAFLEKLVKWCENIKISDPLEEGCRLGPIVSAGQVRKLMYIQWLGLFNMIYNRRQLNIHYWMMRGYLSYDYNCGFIKPRKLKPKICSFSYWTST